LGTPELLDGIVEHVNGIKILADFNRALFRFADFNKCERVEPVALVGALRGAQCVSISASAVAPWTPEATATRLRDRLD
jgi:hypothetical protein